MTGNNVQARLAALPAEVRTLVRQRMEDLSDQPIVRPLSMAQQGLWFQDQLSANDAAYVLRWNITFRGTLDQDALERAIKELIARHASLRTQFDLIDGEPVQIVRSEVPVSVPVDDLRQLNEQDQRVAVDNISEAEATAGFLLSRAPLLRFRLLKLADDENVLLLVVHHIIFDPQSLAVALRELGLLYQCVCEDRPLPALPAFDFLDFATWQREQLQGERLDRLVDFWRESLVGLPELLELPTDRPRPVQQTFAGAELQHRLSADLSDRLQKLAGSERGTMFMVLLAAFQVLLSRHSGQQDLAVGSAALSRGRRQFDTVIGNFANTVVFRGDLSGDPTFREYLRQVRATCLAVYDHQDLPFDNLVRALQPQRSLSYHPVVQATFGMHHVDDEPYDFGDVQLESIETLEFGRSKFDLSIGAARSRDGIDFDVEYSSDLFDHDSAKRLVARFVRLIESVVDEPDTPISALVMLPEEERTVVVERWNDTERPIGNQTLVDLIAAQVERSPDAIAVESDLERLSYRELSERANQLAHHLRAVGVGTEDIVAVAIAHSIDLVVAVLGILRAGAAYCPIDTSHPSDRISYVLSDAAPALLLTSTTTLSDLRDRTSESPNLAARLSPTIGVPCVAIDGPAAMAEISQRPTTDLLHTDLSMPLHPLNAAYVIYTSGSTGQPKGVLVGHRSVVNYLTSTVERHPSLQTGALLHSSMAFDLTVTSFFGPLVAGGRLSIVPSLGPDVAARIADRDFGFIKMTPSHMKLLNAMPELVAPAGDLMVGGESLLGETVAEWRQRRPRSTVINEYGPTEATVGCTTAVIGPDTAVLAGEVSLGRPVCNSRMYVLDGRLQPAPIGVMGELYIGGAGLARGYLNKPDLTADRFIPCPFEFGARMYWTGDLARWDSNGMLSFGGRSDDQIKVRGVRIEPAELIASLISHPAVDNAVIMADADSVGDTKLVAYVVPSDLAAVPTVAALRSHMEKTLLKAMLPAEYQFVAAIPLTTNGKVDNAALRLLVSKGGDADQIVPQPNSQAISQSEALLAEIWADVLGCDHVDIDGDFFDLGGHSLLAIKAVSIIYDTLGVDLSVGAIFEHSTPGTIASAIRSHFDDPADLEAVAESVRAILARDDDGAS